MASNTPSDTPAPDQYTTLATENHQGATETETEPKKDQAQPPTPPPGPRNDSTENRLRPAADVINRIIWDEAFDSEDFVIGYEDRFEGRLEAGAGSWKRDFTDEEFIPQHRILYIKRKADGEVVWDKRRRIDRIFWSGNSACRFLDFLN